MTDLSIGEGARRERRLHSVQWRQQGGDGGRRRLRAPRGRLLLSAPHHDGIHQRTPGAPHPPQGGGRGDARGGLPVELEERFDQAVGGGLSQLGVHPRQVYVHYDRVAGLTLLVLKRRPVSLRLCVRDAPGDRFIFILLEPLDVIPVQLLLLHVLVFILQNDVLQRRHYNLKGIVKSAAAGGKRGLVTSPRLS